MSTFLLILFVIAVALAPLSHFFPSKRQREIARMREYAAVNGMFVEFRDVPGRAGGRIQGRDRAGHSTIYYGRRLPPAKKKGEKPVAWLQDKEGWLAVDRRTPVPATFAQLPDHVLAAGMDEASCGVYWRESGTVEDVEHISGVLERWSRELRA